MGKETRKSELLVLVSLLLVAAAADAGATTINVNAFADVINGNDGNCTLREAVIAANTNTASGTVGGECPAGSETDTINLQTGTYNLTLAGPNEDNAATGDLDIRAPMTIIGTGQGQLDPGDPASGTLVYGNDSDRIFDVHSNFSGAVQIRDLVLAHGERPNNNGGAIYNRGNLTLRRITAFKNEADLGGAVYSTDRLTMIDCIVDGGLSADDGGGLYLTAGSNTTLTRTVFTDNEAGGTGGGIYNSGTLALNQSQLGGFYFSPSNKSTNDAAWGGGIHNTGTGSLTLVQSTIGRNRATGLRGGGLANDGAVTMTNSTISGNISANEGGNISNRNTGTITMLNSTVAQGSAPDGSAIKNQGSISTTNSLFAGACTGADLNSSGGNLESPGNGCGLNQASDQTGVASGLLILYPLSDFGGLTDTNKLGFGSPAIDAALNGPCPNKDQRDEDRPLDGDDSGSSICDIGAFEGAPSLFADGFETGDTSRWAGTFPP